MKPEYLIVHECIFPSDDYLPSNLSQVADRDKQVGVPDCQLVVSILR